MVPSLLGGLLLVGCAAKSPSTAHVPEAVTKNEVEAKGVSARLDWSDWGLVLSRCVVEDKVDYARLLRDPVPLDRFLSLVACVGPESTPDQFPRPADRLVYFINVYNATIVRSVVKLSRDGLPPSNLSSGLDRRFRFRVDGRMRTPASLRQTATRLAGDDWRVAFALCDGHRGSPPLSRRVFLPDMLDAQLNRVVRSSLLLPQIVRIDHGEQKLLRLWRGLYVVKNRLVADFEKRLDTGDATFLCVLLEWSDRGRRETLNSAVGYEVAVLPHDARSNALDPPKPKGKRGLFVVLEDIKRLMP